MDQQKIIREMIKFNKSLLDNTFNGIIITQNQSAKILADALDKATWLSAEGKKAISDWVWAYKKGSDDFKTTIDEKYKNVEIYFMHQENGESAGMEK